jgi:copper(I)-binding protein
MSSVPVPGLPTLQEESTVKKTIIAAALTAVCAGPAAAQVSVKDPWVRATVPQQKATGAFMQIESKADTRLVEASSPAAGVVEIHEMKMENNVMKMRAVKGVDLPAGKAVEFKPGGYHVMLMDLKQQAKEGETFPLTLVFEGKDKKRETVEVKAPVKPLAGGMAKK